MHGPTARELLEAAAACDRAADARTAQEERNAVFAVMAHQETIQIGLLQAQLGRLAQTAHAHERLPLREGGDDVGRVESRIPKGLFFHLMKQKNFGWEGLTSDEGQRDIAKAFPFTRVKTVSGKLTVPVAWRGGRARKPAVNFGPGTLRIAN